MDDARTLRRQRAPRVELPKATKARAWLARLMVASYAISLVAAIGAFLWAAAR